MTGYFLCKRKKLLILTICSVVASSSAKTIAEPIVPDEKVAKDKSVSSLELLLGRGKEDCLSPTTSSEERNIDANRDWQDWKQRIDYEIAVRVNSTCRKQRLTASEKLRTVVRFTVSREGQIAQPQIVTPSSSTIFDSVVLAAIGLMQKNSLLKFPESSNESVKEVTSAQVYCTAPFACPLVRDVPEGQEAGGIRPPLQPNINQSQK